MDILYSLVTDISKDLMCGGVNQLQYSFGFNGFLKALEIEEDNLTETRKNVEDRVKYARKQTLKTTEVIDKWLEKANIYSEDVNSLLTKANAKKSCCFGCCPNWIWRYRLGKKLANKKGDLQKIIKEGKEYIQLERIASIPLNTFDILTEKSMNFDSRKFAFDQLMEALKDDGVATIGLYGMGGCGKTTLAMEVKKIAEAEHLFDTVIFVPVSSTVEVPRIQEKIASSLHYTFLENQELERAQRLCMRLSQEKKVLMILDDVWEKLDCGRIGIPSSEYHKGCKIFITTRSEEVCILMDCQEKIYLPILTDEEAWILFQNKALMFKDTSENIKHLAKSISDECKGLPVAIVAVASSLKGKREAIWHAALNKLRSSKPINIGKGLRDPYMCLQLSYDNLDSEEAKSLFLLCSVFPEDYEISVECLIRCAIGLGVVGEVDTYEEARIEVTAAIIKLVSSCLMMEADHECVKMHDLVRDVAHWIANNENKMIKCEVEKDVSLEQASIRYLWCGKFPNEMDCSNLEFLTIQTNLEVSNGIFERMGKLRVLIITNKDDYELQLSTTSFKALTNLRCLVLQFWKLSDISFVKYMKKLQSISFHHCSWPSFLNMQTDVVVTTLTNLKLLEFNNCSIKWENVEEIKRFPFLEELYIFERYYSDEETVEFFNSFSVSQTLQRYGIILGYNYFYNEFTKDYNWQEFCSYERTLIINYFDISNEVIKGLAKKAKELSVANIEGGAKNIIPDIFQIEEGMNELKKLRIRDCEKIVCLVDTNNHLSKVGNLFSKLHTLNIKNMDHLKALWHGCLPANGCFEKLENLYIEDCPQLTFLFTYIIAQVITELKILHIMDCSILKHIVADDDKTKKSEDKFAIGHSMQCKIFQNLQEMKLYRCGELEHVFSASFTRSPTQLKMLVIAYCNIEQIIEDVLPPVHPKETNEIVEEDEHQQLRFSPRFTSIPSPYVMHNTSESFSLSSLKQLDIFGCPMLGSLFTTSVAKTLTLLEQLNIGECHGLKHIITPLRVKRNKKENMVEDEHEFESDISMFLSLKKVHIFICDSLQDIFAMPFVDGVVNIQNHFPTDQTLRMSNANNGVSLKLEHLMLTSLPEMSHIWVASNNSFTLQNLNSIIITKCEKLEVIFPQCVLRCLPELNHLEVCKCKELRQIIEEDLEDKRLPNILSPQPCFPKLESLVIEQCHKLKYFASVFASNDLSNLKILIIMGPTELKEFIICEYDVTGKTKVELPQLKFIIFMHLSNFHQESIFFNVKYRIIRNCPKLSLTSTITPQELRNLLLEGLEISGYFLGYVFLLIDKIKKFDEVSTSNNSTELPSSQEWDPTLINTFLLQISTSDDDNDDSQKIQESEIQEFQKIDRKSEMSEVNLPVICSPNMAELTDEMEANKIGKTTTSDKLPIPTSVLELVNKESNNEIGFPSHPAFGETMNIKDIGRQRIKDGPLSEEATIKTHKPDEVTRASTDIRTRLEECKHFADLDDSQISLLVEAISAYPHLWKACEKFSDRFQALMLKTLTDMLLFLRSESIGSVNPHKEKEFLKLCDEAVQLGFEKSWVDEMRQRVVGRDPKFDHAKARTADLLKRHAHLTKELQNMKIELMSLHHYFDVSTKCFDFL